MGFRSGLVVATLIALAAPALAQPGRTPPQPPAPQPPAPQPQPYPQPQPNPQPQPQYGYPPQPVQLTAEEYKILQKGEYSDGQTVGGGLLGLFIGFGTGHLVQQRWTEKGWLFTVGDTAAYFAFLVGFIDCVGDSVDGTNNRCNAGLMVGGALAFAGLRIWETIDLFATPPAHNRRVREIRARIYNQQYYRAPPPPPPVYLRPVDGGFAGGVQLRF